MMLDHIFSIFVFPIARIFDLALSTPPETIVVHPLIDLALSDETFPN